MITRKQRKHQNKQIARRKAYARARNIRKNKPDSSGIGLRKLRKQMRKMGLL